MIIEKLTVGPFQCNCVILGCEHTQEAIVIDPGAEPERIVQKVQSLGLKPKFLIHTHAHLDHVGGTLGVQQKVGGESCLHEEDLFLFEHVPMQAALFNFPVPPTGKIDQYLSQGDTVSFGSHHLEVFHTPGHTPGSLCFLSQQDKESHLFTGDTLFLGSIGRTDLWGGDFKQIQASIRNKLLPLNENTVLHPGHGPNSTLEQEKKSNPFVLEMMG